MIPSVLRAGKVPDRLEQIDLFREANQLFHQANAKAGTDATAAGELYRQAALRLERIAQHGPVRNGKLYYDIGNAWFRADDLGRAILNYRRAEKYMPNNPDLRQNLDYARTRCLDKIPEAPQTWVLKTLFFWHYDFSARAKAGVFTIFFVSLWICGGLRLWVRRGWLRSGMAVSAAVAALMLGSLAAEAIGDAQNIGGVVLNAEVTARKGDGETYQPSFREPLHAGTEFQLRENRGDWYYIELADGRDCWVPARAVGLVKP